MVSGYTKPLILLPSESVWVSLSRTMEKNDDRKGNKKAWKKAWKKGRRRREEDEDSQKEAAEEAVRWYPQVRAPLYTRLEKAPRLRGHSKFSGALPTPPGITLEIDVARPRNLGAVQTARFFSPLHVSLSPQPSRDEEGTYLLYLP